MQLDPFQVHKPNKTAVKTSMSYQKLYNSLEDARQQFLFQVLDQIIVFSDNNESKLKVFLVDSLNRFIAFQLVERLKRSKKGAVFSKGGLKDLVYRLKMEWRKRRCTVVHTEPLSLDEDGLAQLNQTLVFLGSLKVYLVLITKQRIILGESRFFCATIQNSTTLLAAFIYKLLLLRPLPLLPSPLLATILLDVSLYALGLQTAMDRLVDLVSMGCGMPNNLNYQNLRTKLQRLQLLAYQYDQESHVQHQLLSFLLGLGPLRLKLKKDKSLRQLALQLQATFGSLKHRPPSSLSSLISAFVKLFITPQLKSLDAQLQNHPIFRQQLYLAFFKPDMFLPLHKALLKANFRDPVRKVWMSIKSLYDRQEWLRKHRNQQVEYSRCVLKRLGLYQDTFVGAFAKSS